MRELAEHLARQGRNGDTMLLHVSPSEVAALQGIGALTRNPTTGLPEAFKFASLIPAIVGIGASVLSGGTLSPLMAGLISGVATTAVTGDWRQGLMGGISGGAMAGVGNGIGEMMGNGATEAIASTQVPQAAASLGADAGMGAGAGAGFQGIDMGGGAAGMGSAFNGGQAGEGLYSSMEAAAPAAAPLENLSGMDMAADAGAGASSPYNQMTSTLQPGRGATLQEAFGGKHLFDRTLPGGLAAMGVLQGLSSPSTPAMNGVNNSGLSQAEIDNAKVRKVGHRDYTPASDPYYALHGGEPNMFSPLTYAQGGIAGLPAGQDGGATKVVRAIRSHYRSRKDAIKDMQVQGSFINQLGLQDPNDPLLDYAFGYTKNQGKAQAQAQPEDMMTPAFAGGGRISDGMSDSIPAVIGGKKPASLSEGEFVVPADVVSHLGNGSTKAGGKHLYNMVDRVRMARTGQRMQAPAINPKKFLPS